MKKELKKQVEPGGAGYPPPPIKTENEEGNKEVDPEGAGYSPPIKTENQEGNKEVDPEGAGYSPPLKKLKKKKEIKKQTQRGQGTPPP